MGCLPCLVYTDYDTFYADIFISQLRSAGGSPPQCQLTVKDVFRNPTILHTADMTQPSPCALSKQSVGPYILGRPARDRNSALITLSCQNMTRILRMLFRCNVLSLLSCPVYLCLAAIQKCADNTGIVTMPYLSSQTA